MQMTQEGKQHIKKKKMSAPIIKDLRTLLIKVRKNERTIRVTLK